MSQPNAWLGQGDTNGTFIPSSLIYSIDNSNTPPTPPPTPGVGVAILPGGYVGMTWMKNVMILTKEYWDSGLAAPYQGQLWPTNSNPGPGQVFPF